MYKLTLTNLVIYLIGAFNVLQQHVDKVPLAKATKRSKFAVRINLAQSRSAGLYALSAYLFPHPWTHTTQLALLRLLDDLVLPALLLLDSSLAPLCGTCLIC